MNIGNIDNTPRTYKIKNTNQEKHKIIIRNLPKDTFEKTKEEPTMDNNNDNLQFKRVKIAFYPEDVEKMKGMTTEERIRFKQELKDKNRYTIAEEEKNS